MREAMRNEARLHGQDEAALAKIPEWQELDGAFAVLCEEFGPAFATEYGWAAHQQEKKKLTFQDLERAVDWSSLPPSWK